MSLSSGTQLGPYEILTLIGAGGMGEVYRARDTKLGRDVALKILPETFATDPDRLARFKREAQVLASLDHPNIGAIYGFEDSDGVHALVLQLVEGPTLADRIADGRISIDEALPIGRQIAEALEAAHDQGIIHRDLKPANIKLRADGTVKVLDFGLAKAANPGSGLGPLVSDPMNSPTLSIHATQSGVILGTVGYMSPEQASGKAVDRRSDLWAFGAVMFEMLTGRPAFTGETPSHVFASVLRSDPDWTALPAHTPAPIRRLLRRCLEKDRKLRLDSAAAARLEIEEALRPPADGVVRIANPEPGIPNPLLAWPRWLPWAVTAAAVTAVVVVMPWAHWAVAEPANVTRTTLSTPSSAALNVNGTVRDLAISPDGRHVVYAGNGGTQLFARAMDALGPTAIASGTNLRGVFASPDGRWIGFVAGINTLRKVAIGGGPSIALTTLDAGSRGATWASDDTIIFATSNVSTGLQRVSAAGGSPEVLTRPDHAKDEADHLWPEALPGGGAVLFTITSQTGGLDAAQVAVLDLRTRTQKVLLRGGSHAHIVAGRYLVYVAAGTLRAILFDSTRLETRGSAVPVLSRLATTSGGGGDFAVANDGTLVYVDAPGNLPLNARTLVWVDRAGNEELIAAPPRAYEYPRLSPDGTRVVVSSQDQEEDLLVWEFARATLTRLTLDPNRDWFPVWTADGRRIVFSSNRTGQANLWWQAADGTGTAERLTTSSNAQSVTASTPDGKAVLFHEATPTMGRDLMQLALDGTHRITPLLQTKADERNGTVSHDGRWLAYDSNASGSFEIYVRPYPNVGGGQWQVSTAGGARPVWSRDGKELIFLSADGALLAVPVEANGATWHAGVPAKLFDGRYVTGAATAGPPFDVSLDGRRFLMIKALGTGTRDAPPELVVVQNWQEELKQRVPTR